MQLPAPFRDLRTYISLISVSIGIFGLYHYYESVQVRVPTYAVSPTRARLVDNSIQAPPQLQVLYNGRELKDNVSSMRVYFWNAGKLPIKPEDLLTPLKVELDPACEIVDARILKASREVINFTSGALSPTQKNVVPISFRILEKNDGAALQIIYIGKPDTHISVSGTIVGAGAPQELTEPEGRLPRTRKQKILAGVLTVLGLLILGALGKVVSMASHIVYEGGAKLFGAPSMPSKRFTRISIAAFVLGTFIGVTTAYTVFEVFKPPAVPSSMWVE